MSLLEVRGLTKSFGGLMAVNDLSFDVEEGEVVGIIGPNGAGKTTAFATVAGFLKASAGTISFYNRRIDGLESFDVCRLGLVRTFQIVQPFMGLQVLKNVMMGALMKHGKEAEAVARAWNTLQVVGMTHLADRMARDLTLIEQKRLELARALAVEPRLIMLDEIMAGLRPAEVDEMVSLILNLRRGGITFLVTEHVMQAMMAVADRIIVMHCGKKIAEGKPLDIVNNRLVVEAYLGEEEVVA